MSAPAIVDLVFNVLGTTIPQEHGYASLVLPDLTTSRVNG